MENCIGVILNENLDKNFGSLCNHRPSYMLPYAGRYRLLDFALSNIVSYDIKNVVLYTGVKMRSAMDHIGSGRPWGLNRRFSGLRLFSPYYRDSETTRNDQITQLFNTIKFFEDAKEEYVFLMQPSVIAKVDLDEAFEAFVASDADVSLIYKKQDDPHGRHVHFDKLHLNSDGTFKEIGLNLGIDKEFNHFLGMGFIKKDVNLTTLSKQFETNTKYLSEIIKIHRQKPFNLYLNELRINYIVNRLKNEPKYISTKVSYLASDCGFASHSTFTTIFTQIMNESPSVFVKRIKEEQKKS